MKKNLHIMILIFMVVSNMNGEKISELQKFMAGKQVKPLLENNPIAVHKLSADPAVLVYKDTVYVYATNDAQQAESTLGKQDNGFNLINTLNVFSSKDLVNWTDCGEIAVAGKNNPQGPAKWATNSWAPAICWKNIDGIDKFFLYFADSGNGIGVVTSDSPLGPFVDPIGKPLVSRNSPNCQKVYWLFDPAVMVDDDGNGYLYFGGGVEKDIAHPKSARCAKLSDDMTSLACDPIEIDAPWLFEDSGINKFGDTYYYTYCANWSDRTGFTGSDVPPTAVIAYMTSKSPLGPFTYQGWTLKNPGSYFGPWGNNHHWIFTFKGKNYIAYHAQTTEKAIGFEKGGYRSIFINEFLVNADGSLPVQSASKKGVNPVVKFNPYEVVPASTMVNSANVAITAGEKGRIAVAMENKAFILLRGVDFSKGVSKVTVKTKSTVKDGSLKFYAKNLNSENLICEVKCNDAGQWSETAKFQEINEAVDLLIVMSKGVELESWCFE